MRIALGLDVAAVPTFAAILPLQSGARATALPDLEHWAPSPDRIDSIVDATRDAIGEVTAREGTAPVSVALVHPLAWDLRQVQRLRRALARAELSDVLVLTSAAAAAIGTDALRPLSRGRRVTVLAFRPDGVDLQALRKDGDSSFSELGAVRSISGVTEGELDALLLGLVEAKLPGRLPVDRSDPAVQEAFTALGEAVHVARERLCVEDSAIVGVRLPGRAAVIQVTREEFETAAAPVIAPMLQVLLTAIHDSSASTGGVDQVILTGMTAPTPLIAHLLSTDLRIPVVVAPPGSIGSVGAAWAAGAAAPAAETSIAAAPIAAAAAAPIAERIQAELSNGAALTASALAATTADEFGDPDPATERRRRPLTLLQLWPITAAAAILVAFAGTVSSGVLDVTPAGSHPTSPATAPADRAITTAPDAGQTSVPFPTPAPAATFPAAPATPGAGKTTKKGTGTKGATSPAVPVVPTTPESPSASPSPSDTPTPTPDPTPPATDPPTDPPAPVP